jgi:hypothetical protein
MAQTPGNPHGTAGSEQAADHAKSPQMSDLTKAYWSN